MQCIFFQIYLNFSNKFSNREELAAHSLRLSSVGSSTASTQPLILGDDVFFDEEQRHESAWSYKAFWSVHSKPAQRNECLRKL